MNAATQKIEQQLKENDIILYMKGNKDFPMCGFSSRVVQILTDLGADFKTINVLEDDDIREGIKQFSNWPTLPQLYIKGEFIGGCDIVCELYESGELKQKVTA